MKKLILLFTAFVLLFGFGACHGPSDENNFDETLLYGKWQEGSVFERYYDSAIDFVMSNGDTVQVNGTTWDTSDDVSEDEAQAFNWTLTGSTLTHEHIGTFVTVPKVYTINSLTSSELNYSDDYGNTHVFSKVKE